MAEYYFIIESECPVCFRFRKNILISFKYIQCFIQYSIFSYIINLMSIIHKIQSYNPNKNSIGEMESSWKIPLKNFISTWVCVPPTNLKLQLSMDFLVRFITLSHNEFYVLFYNNYNNNNVIHLELCKMFKFKHSNKWYMLNLESVLENELHKHFLGFWDTNRSPNLFQTTRLNDSEQRKKRTYQIVDCKFKRKWEER